MMPYCIHVRYDDEVIEYAREMIRLRVFPLSPHDGHKTCEVIKGSYRLYNVFSEDLLL